ncbi:hypothetical protein GT3570_15210 [Geobacillus thermoleovorans]|uniref:hypothetical protein n=1 Tax=Geobacillus TaxID=129337 RepID=UPI00078E1624|nr:hypothetical protein [Geobacillus sp. DSP4a]AMV12263.1 hypothetical protein GT3570_15210 [Geobacillus thermoleovorans]NNU99300.1 hypothetical protein [Geobacillus sp. DSP4a]
MRWAEIRQTYPNQFVLVEAVSACSQHGKRMIEDMAVVGCYEHVSEAWSSYKQQHRTFPEKELYIFHTSNERIEVEERYFIGARGRECPYHIALLCAREPSV